MFLASCTQNSIEAYRSSFRGGKLRFYWRTVHNLFRAGAALIYCLKNWPTDCEIDLESANKSLGTCSSILWGMVERYPAGSPCRDTFETLYDSVRGLNKQQLFTIQPQLQANCGPAIFPTIVQDNLAQSFEGLPNDFSLQDISMQDFITWET